MLEKLFPPTKKEEPILVPITDENFEAEVLGSALPIMVDFSSEGCGPCRMAKPVVEQLAEEYKGRLKVGAYDIAIGLERARELGVDRIPLFVMFNNKQEVRRWSGFRPIEKMREEVRLGLLPPQEKPQV